jgi:predicted anti-sigma-YlaC factor YlaD
MSHQPFESWIINDEPLQPKETIDLEAHLQDCVACRQLYDSWQGVQGLFGTVPLVAPRQGFVQRWEQLLEQDLVDQRVTVQRRNSWIFVLVSGCAALIVFFLLIMQIWQTENLLTSFILTFARLLTGTLSLVNTLQYAVSSIVEILIALIPPIWWGLMMIVICALCTLWFLSLRHIWSPRRITQ